MDDDLNLFYRIRKILPENDRLNFNKRIELLNWSKVSVISLGIKEYNNIISHDQVKFKNYSSMDCRKRFIFVLTTLRTHKVLSEILKDAATSLDDDQVSLIVSYMLNLLFV